jgi:hypothetical protein
VAHHLDPHRVGRGEQHAPHCSAVAKAARAASECVGPCGAAIQQVHCVAASAAAARTLRPAGRTRGAQPAGPQAWSGVVSSRVPQSRRASCRACLAPPRWWGH